MAITYQQIQVHTLLSDFCRATKILDVPEVPKHAAGNVVVKNAYVGINAADISIANGAIGRPVPFPCGLEAVGTVVSVGEGVTKCYNWALAEFTEVVGATVLKTPELSLVVVPLTVSGLSASVAVSDLGELKSGETVLVTAAAGGTGQFVVQLAKLAGNHVIGTTSSDDKAEYLKSIGCDRVINYKKEDVSTVLQNEYPQGVDIVFETIGGSMFRAAVDNLAVHGRVILFGMISGYQGQKTEVMTVPELAGRLFAKSGSVRAYLMRNHAKHLAAHMEKLLALIAEKKLNAGIDPVEFMGLDGGADALDHMFAGKNVGKVIITSSGSESMLPRPWHAPFSNRTSFAHSHRPAMTGQTYQQIQVHTLSSDFRKATKIVDVPEVPTPAAGKVVVQNAYVGINATDINITAGAGAIKQVPFPCGLEAGKLDCALTSVLGTVVSVGEGVTECKVGDYVAYQQLGAFAEYVEVPSATVLKTPELSPVVVLLTISGLSASIALSEVGQMTTGETILVTAAAGGTGQFVVQLAKLAGNHVIGTTSSDDKAEYLKSIGCDRVINYKKEDVSTVLQNEYPQGVDIVFETIGGSMFRAAVDNLAVHGRVILFGMISGYQGQKTEVMTVPELAGRLFAKSGSVRAYLMRNHAKHLAAHMEKLLALIAEKKLNAGIDPVEFVGLESVADALDHIFAGKNVGKVMVRLA
ncbi:TPA: hypothetical protein N0F65_003011 [Lagenidium giganteum]|uniref:Enoyl reductase (ER) domain-containing protein n=1 Tax=Lagenidium giganteum TaxID=4803 RepID=A0AAV2YU39_9STRA|nr:TPA: hypothetical protein N0F65_003011 [Lagenidium giganteum]